MKTCRFCEKFFTDERPYDYCRDDDCVALGLHYRRNDFALVLVPKQSFTYVAKSDTATLQGGRSSGR